RALGERRDLTQVRVGPEAEGVEVGLQAVRDEPDVRREVAVDRGHVAGERRPDAGADLIKMSKPVPLPHEETLGADERDGHGRLPAARREVATGKGNPRGRRRSERGFRRQVQVGTMPWGRVRPVPLHVTRSVTPAPMSATLKPMSKSKKPHTARENTKYAGIPK